MHNGHWEKAQRIGTQTIRQTYRACQEKERHNGHGRQIQSNDNQQINKTDRDKWEQKTHNGHREKENRKKKRKRPGMALKMNEDD